VTAFVAGVTIDASRGRDAAAQRAPAALGRLVALQDPLQLTLGHGLVLRAAAVQVGNPPCFEAPAFAAIDAACVRIDLFDALCGRLRLRSLEASDIGLWLERAGDGRGNWSPATPRVPGSASMALHIGKIELKRMAVHVHDARRATRHQIEFESLYLRTAPDGALHLALHGMVDAWPAYRLQLDGGPLHLQQQGAEPWPFKLELRAGRPGDLLHARAADRAGAGHRAGHAARRHGPGRGACGCGPDAGLRAGGTPLRRSCALAECRARFGAAAGRARAPAPRGRGLAARCDAPADRPQPPGHRRPRAACRG
jgi:hypothetical protein